MKETFQLYPERRFYTIKQLEKKLHFKYLPYIAFNNLKEQKEIQKRGIEKWKNNEVKKKAIMFGKRFIKKIKKSYIPKVSIHYINEKIGYGLIAEENIDTNCYVGEYTGIICENNKYELNNYLYKYPLTDNIGRNLVVDATQGHLTRFINHSYNPNLLPVSAFYEGFYHLIFLSIYPIKKGEQLTFNYGKNYWYTRSLPFIL